MKEIRRIAEVKEGKAWRQTYVTTDEKEVYESLARDLVAKKLHKATYIKSVKDVSNYDGTRDITVTYDNGVRSVYTIKM